MQIGSNRLIGHRLHPVMRGGAALAVIAVVTLWLWGESTALVAVVRGRPAAAAELITLAVSAAALLILGWLALVVALETAALAPGTIGALAGRGARALTPRLARQVALLVLGVGVATSCGPTQAVAGSLRAATTTSSPASPDRQAAPDLPAPGWLPLAGLDDLPEPGWVPPPPPARPTVDPAPLIGQPAPRDAEDTSYVVRRGDTLWAIAAAHLPVGATDAEICAEWPRWYAVNRATIGADPDLILPGQILTAPTPLSEGALR